MKSRLGLSALCLVACHSAGPYGHSPNYAPLSEEVAALAGAKDYDPVMFARQPDEWRKQPVALFGVVESRAPGQSGAALLKLTVRRLEPRNLCESDKDDDTCRVTVSDKDFGVVYALVQLKGDDDVGPRAVGVRSLLRIAAKVGAEINPTDGAPVMHATYYRHWPVYSYVTKSASRAPAP